jgi:hypothetical protein
MLFGIYPYRKGQMLGELFGIYPYLMGQMLGELFEGNTHPTFFTPRS